ncbi:hypothetical protein F3N42_04000 [Marinihelvus fidelis]|uniref:Uncharacterized protein n=1 Tax=Marinihelvus fidelis TaxID=2613842 RepID=A0A5N0TJL7_9GAMM|nr:hypothetical protein [Marinihelvus fidelis]KAA9133519.1 hypothetical protein F3N42_04000 [Marinihelvus fidelis]
MKRNPWWLAVLTSAVVTLSGCGSLGPKTVQQDQVDYGFSVAQSWKNQMLANLVKLRYVDMPVFVDVGQIVNGYSLETTVNGGLGFGNALGGGDTQALGATGRYTDRPTITYTPKTGTVFLRSLLEPIAPDALLSLVAVGYNAELLFTWGVESVNGVKNYSTNGARTVEPAFKEFTRRLTELQASGGIGFEIRAEKDTGRNLIFFFNDENESEFVRDEHRRARELLGLDEARHEYVVQYSPYRIGDDVLAIQTRSILQVLMGMSRFVEVPADKASRAVPGFQGVQLDQAPFHVNVGSSRPDEAYASVRYGGDWYWIDHDDLSSKRVFTLMMFLVTLTDHSGPDVAPVLTIPAQ